MQLDDQEVTKRDANIYLPLDSFVDARSMGTKSTMEHGIKIAINTGAKMYSGVDRNGR